MKKYFIIPILCILCIIGGSVILYQNMEETAFYTEKFPEQMTINGVDCSGMTIDEAEAAITEEWNSREFTFTRSGEELGSITPDNLTYDITKSLKNVRKDSFLLTAWNYYFDMPVNFTIPMPVEEITPEFMEELKNAKFLQEKKVTKTRDAYLDLSGQKARIVPEVVGNSINYKEVADLVAGQIEAGKFSMEFIKKEFYEEPKVTTDDPNLVEREELYNKNLKANITYILGDEEVTIPISSIAKIYGIDVKTTGEVTDKEREAMELAGKKASLNEEEVKAFVEAFAEEYNTMGMKREFTAASGNKIEIKGGDYGYFLDNEKEYEQLLKDLKKNKAVKREPIWKYEGFVEYNKKDDIGDTYVEISISGQHLWYCKDGEILFDCPVVTGNPYMGYSTPTGTFSLTYKTTNATLNGFNADGTEYASPVSYWMPFYGNYGMHDAPWRGSFGGSIYRGNGSHGCVNMPGWAAGKLYNNIADSNVPVIVHP